MKSRLPLLSLLLSLLLPSCATRLACDSSAPRLSWKHPKTSKDASEEVRVSSYISGRTEDGFTLTEVNRINHLPQCGMDLFATFLTLGLIPHSAPNPIRATVTGYVDGRRKTETFALSIDRHTSLWHNLLPERHDDRVIARALLQAVRHRKEHDPEMQKLLNQYGKLELERLKANKG